jgi:bifunctional non-homologous end joining protein LigD
MANRNLSLYKEKRDFTKTSEPSGKARVKSAEYPRFVIQKHAASRLHFDLRLELDGVFKSWAVTKGPSLDPRDRRLAVETEDHPLDYGDFEGMIPKGEYGGGTVMLWDRGFWAPDQSGNPAHALHKGELKFTIAGEKLQGSWVIVRLRHDRERSRSNRNNWLLIKHRDGYEREGMPRINDRDRSVASGRTMNDIAEGKGAPPKPFMLAGKGARANAVWHSNRAEETGKMRPVVHKPVKPGHSSQKMPNAVLGIVISNPDKSLWPSTATSEKYSKIDLARYLEEVGPWMLDHLRGRPCSLIRTPDGINGQQFFQRHGMQGMSNLINLVSFEAKRKPYVQIDSEEALIAAAQIAAVEYHPWNNQPGDPRRPGRLVFDLDPAPDVEFNRVIEAAKELKARLERLGLATFCKTTGGKGLHVVTPLTVKSGEGLGWPEAKTFAQAVCSHMAQDSPERYLIVMTKKLRTGRIFLDYLRNDRMATAVAPLSPRARPGAPVSMPLNWSQVKRGLNPQQFTVRTGPALLRKSKPWRDYCEQEQPLRQAIEKLVRGS